MGFGIVGSSMQTLLVELSDGEAVYTERGRMAWLSNVDMDTSAWSHRGGTDRVLSGETRLRAHTKPKRLLGLSVCPL